MAIDWGNATFSTGTGLTSQAQPDWIIQAQQQQQMQYQYQQTAAGGTLSSGNYFYNCTFTQPMTITTSATTDYIVFVGNSWVNGNTLMGGSAGGTGGSCTQQPIELTAEQAEQFRRQQAEWAEREEKAREELAAAELKAQALIEEIFAEDELKQLRTHGYVDVPVRNVMPRGLEVQWSKFQGAFKFYRIRANAGINLVDCVGKEKGYICIHSQHPDGVLPPSDDLCAKYWMCRFDEKRLWEIGNFSLR